MISIQNLHAELMARQSKRYTIYEEVFQKVVSKIKYENSKTDTCYCLYKLPVWVFGVPLYNMNACAEYITNKLRENYFHVYFTPPNILHIYWNLRPNTYTQPYTLQNSHSLPHINTYPNNSTIPIANTMTMHDLQNARQLAINPTKKKQSIFEEIDKAFLETSSGILKKPTGDPRFNRPANIGLSIDDLRNQQPPDLDDILSALDS